MKRKLEIEIITSDAVPDGEMVIVPADLFDPSFILRHPRLPMESIRAYQKRIVEELSTGRKILLVKDIGDVLP